MRRVNRWLQISAQRFEMMAVGAAKPQKTASPENGRMLVSIQNILDRKGAEVFTIEPTATVRTAAQLMQAQPP